MNPKLLSKILLLLSMVATPLRASDYREMACGLGGCPTGNIALHEKFGSWEFVISRDLSGNFESGITDFFRNTKFLSPKDEIESLYFELPKKECAEGRQGIGDLYCKAQSIRTYLQIREGETYINSEHIYKTKTLLAEVEDFQNQWRMREELKHPKFKIGTKETFAIYLWPHYLRGLKKLYPHYEFELTIKRTNVDLLELLNDNKLDMLMIPDPREREDLRSFEVFKETYGIFGAKSFKSPLERAEIFTFKNAMAAENRTIQGILAREGISVGMVVDVDSFGVAKAMMLQGLGLALLPKSVVQHELSSGAVKPVIADFSPSAMGVLKICLTIHERNAGRSELKTLLSEIRRMQKNQFEIKTAKYAN